MRRALVVSSRVGKNLFLAFLYGDITDRLTARLAEASAGYLAHAVSGAGILKSRDDLRHRCAYLRIEGRGGFAPSSRVATT